MIKKLFTFWKKKEIPKIKWWSTIEGLESVAPIVPAKEYIPDWWKNIRASDYLSITDKGTVKNCPSFFEFFSNGFVVPLWCDLHLRVTDTEWEYKTPYNKFTFTSHNNNQFKDFVPPNYKDNIKMVLKPDCPWRVKTPPGWSISQFPMYYHYNPIFEVLPGNIWSDFHYEINQQMVIKQTGEFEIKKGTPLAMYIPYERKKYDYTIDGPNEENVKLTNTSSLKVLTKFRGGYKNTQAKIRRQEEKKCPFS